VETAKHGYRISTMTSLYRVDSGALRAFILWRIFIKSLPTVCVLIRMFGSTKYRGRSTDSRIYSRPSNNFVRTNLLIFLLTVMTCRLFTRKKKQNTDNVSSSQHHPDVCVHVSLYSNFPWFSVSNYLRGVFVFYHEINVRIIYSRYLIMSINFVRSLEFEHDL